VRRFVSPLLFLAVVACFVLPFVTVTSVARQAHATGIDLVAGSASFSGTYTHAAYEGEVETIVENARIPAIVVLVFAFVGASATLLPGRNALRVGFASAIVAGLAYLALLQVTAPRFAPPEADHHGGFWLAGALVLGALAWGALRLWRDPGDAAAASRSPERAPSWLR
jgi:hypothetical protein